MKTRTLPAILAILVLLPAAAAMAEKAEKQQKPEGEQPKELSNTRIASCLVKITCDPAVLPLNLYTIEYLLHSSGVGAKAIRETLGIAALTDETEVLVQFGIEPLSDDPASDKPKKAGRRAYGVAPGEEDKQEEYMREMKVLARKEPAMPMPDATTYTSQQTFFFRLRVELESDVKPAAEEFMKALIDNLRKTLNAAFGDYSKRFRQQLEFADDDVRHAEGDLAGLQKKLREILGSYNLERQVILDDISRSRKDLRATQMEHGTNQALMEEIPKRIAETEKKMMNKLANDPVLAELQKIIGIHEERLKTLVHKNAPEPETSQARENLARARIELAERREQVSRSAGAELINSLRNQISDFTIQQARLRKRIDQLESQLDNAGFFLEKADDYELVSLRLKIAKQTFEETLLLHSRMKRRGLLISPSVVVFGAD